MKPQTDYILAAGLMMLAFLIVPKQTNKKNKWWKESDVQSRLDRTIEERENYATPSIDLTSVRENFSDLLHDNVMM
jgi:hypothetical protein